MATAQEVKIVRLNIDDLDVEDFDDSIIVYFIDQENSVNYASWKLCEILLVRLRKEILKRDTTGAESTEFVDLKTRIDLLEDLAEKFKNDYDSEYGLSTGRFLESTKPTIAGGDV